MVSAMEFAVFRRMSLTPLMTLESRPVILVLSVEEVSYGREQKAVTDARDVQNSLCHDKTHREEEIRRRYKRYHHQSQAL